MTNGSNLSFTLVPVFLPITSVVPKYFFLLLPSPPLNLNLIIPLGRHNRSGKEKKMEKPPKLSSVKCGSPVKSSLCLFLTTKAAFFYP